jgi:hypothetical protein
VAKVPRRMGRRMAWWSPGGVPRACGRGTCAGLSWWSGCCRAVMVLLIPGWE